MEHIKWIWPKHTLLFFRYIFYSWFLWLLTWINYNCSLKDFNRYKNIIMIFEFMWIFIKYIDEGNKMHFVLPRLNIPSFLMDMTYLCLKSLKHLVAFDPIHQKTIKCIICIWSFPMNYKIRIDVKSNTVVWVASWLWNLVKW